VELIFYIKVRKIQIILRLFCSLSGLVAWCYTRFATFQLAEFSLMTCCNVLFTHFSRRQTYTDYITHFSWQCFHYLKFGIVFNMSCVKSSRLKLVLNSLRGPCRNCRRKSTGSKVWVFYILHSNISFWSIFVYLNLRHSRYLVKVVKVF
jgi:hypothetical protein